MDRRKDTRNNEILESIENEEQFWNEMAYISMKNIWNKEDKPWNKLAKMITNSRNVNIIKREKAN
jgi:hypothetical protein